uniref:Heme O synthase n=1 Tax=Syphacia muris TaxID=451379 RepID=A0A0N5AJI1_9BILA
MNRIHLLLWISNWTRISRKVCVNTVCKSTQCLNAYNGGKLFAMASSVKKSEAMVLNETDWNEIKPQKLFKSYLQISKFNLTALITLTAAGGYIMSTPTLSWTVFPCILGTSLLSSSANAVNQLIESPYDAQMTRTSSRLLVIHRFTPLHTCGFALLTGSFGSTILWFGCNWCTAILGLINFFLYVVTVLCLFLPGVYTPLKRHSIICTWVGAIVGAIPPLMGCAGSGNITLSSVILSALVYCWQFPHFNGLSWNLRDDYTRAGYRVMCVVNERLCRASSLRNTLALIPLCSIGAPLSGLTTWTFSFGSLPLNLYFSYLSLQFYHRADSKSARSLFIYSLLYLPLIFILMFLSKLESILGKKSSEEPHQVHL